MKVTAISALHQAIGKVHPSVALDQIHNSRHGTQQLTVSPTAAKIELGPNAAGRFNPSDHINEFTLLTPSSSTSLAAQHSDINLLSEPDAVAQEMTSNLRPSMSQSGEANLDITMPDNPIGTSAFELEQRKELDLPMALRNMQEQFADFYDGPNEWVQQETEYTELDKTYVVPPTKRNEPLLEVAVATPPPDFLFTPNRAGERPPNITPQDIPFTEVPTRVSELQPISDALGVLATEQRQKRFEQIEQSRISQSIKPIQEDRTEAQTFQLDDLELQQQAKPLKESAAEVQHSNMPQAIDALLQQFNLSLN